MSRSCGSRKKRRIERWQSTRLPRRITSADALTKALDAHIIQKHVSGIGAEILSDRHPLTPMIDHDEGGAIKEEEEIGTEEELGDNRNHEINMTQDRCVDHMRRNQGDRRSVNEY